MKRMSEARVIKKYPNRRLYDTRESRYITLNDIRQLVVDGEPFEVIDKKSGDDITRAILLQVIAEQEQSDASVMSEDFLSQIIRSYSGNMNTLVGGYLERSLSMFMDQQQKMSESWKDIVGVQPFGAVTDLAQRNLNQWMDMQKQMLEAFAPPKRRDPRSGTDDS
jgi:polyhydroxyalkanoate synthesis repressor PhaR